MATQITSSKKRIVITMRPFVILFLVVLCTSRGHTQESSKAIIARSNFIFSGTILKMNAANIDIKATSPTAIVRVDEVIDAIAPYEQMKGKEITVLLASDKNKQAGEQQVFYTTGWYYGKTLGVKEVPNNQPKEMQDTLKRFVTLQRTRIHVDSLRDELGKAILVIQGTVVETNSNTDSTPAIESEHDPELRKAVIGIQEVLKGRISSNQVIVYYSASDDVMWYNSPKLFKGQKGIFLLNTGQAPAIFRVRGYTLLDQRDVQSIASLPDIEGLLKN